MAKKKQQTVDITKTGLNTYRQLQEQNREMQGIPDFESDGFIPLRPTNRASSVTTNDPLQNMERDVYSPLYGNGDYWGNSRHDSKVARDNEWEHLGDIRAEDQSSIGKILNGTIKMAITAATTFLDGTVGALYGLIQGGANLVDRDPETGFWQGLWDNDFNRAMAEAQDIMEKVAPNYYTEQELQRPWYQNIWSANFLGDKLLKNAGFTIGAMATMAMPGTIGAAAEKGITGLSKLIAAKHVFDNAGKALRIARNGRATGGIANKLVNSFISANGEAAIESINAVRANEDAINQNIQNWVNNAKQRAWDEYLVTGDEGLYQQRMGEIQQGSEQALEEYTSTMRGLGNSVYFGNIALLMLTNNLEFGKYIKGGWHPQKGIQGMTMKIGDNVVTKDMKEFGKALAKGTGRLEVPSEIGKISVGRVIGGTAARFAEEGFEEGAQNIISDSGQMQAQAKINKAWKTKHYDPNSLLDASINPEVTDELVDRMKAIGEAWNKNFGSGFDAPGWEEVFLGGLTGGLGTISVHTDPNTKKWNVWQGGFVEELRKPREERAAAEKVVAHFNEYVDSDKFRDKVKYAVAGLTYAEQMEDALAKDDIMAFKNAELMSVVNSALFFRNYGALEAFKGFYEGMAENVTDEDIADIKAQMRNVETGQSWFDTKTNEELKQNLKDKAQSTLDKINSTLDTFDQHLELYGDKFTKAAGEDVSYKGIDVIRTSIQDLTGKAVLINDLERRKKELEEQRNSISPLTLAVRGDTYTKQIEQVQEKIDQFTSEYKNWISHPEKLIDKIKESIDFVEKYEIGKDASKAKERLKEVTTMQEVADFYFSTKPEIRQKVFDQATSEAEGEPKELLMGFRPFLGTLNSLTTLIDKLGDQYAKPVYDEAAQADKEGYELELEGDVSQNLINEAHQQADMLRTMGELQKRNYTNILNREVQNIVDGFLQDKDVAYTKQTLENAFLSRANELRTSDTFDRSNGNNEMLNFIANELEQIAHSVKNLDDTYRESDAYQDALRKKEEERKAKKEAEPVKEEQTKAEPKKSEEEKEPDFYAPQETGTEVPENPLGVSVESEEEQEESNDERLFSEGGKSLSPTDTSLADTDEQADQIEDARDISKDEALPENVSEGKEQFASEEKPQPATKSFRGNAFHRYKTSMLSSNEGIAKEQSNKSVKKFYELMKEKGFDIDYIQSRYAKKLMDANDGRIPVQYMIMHGKKRGDASGRIAGGSSVEHIFLVTPYNGMVENIVPRTDSHAAGNIIESEGREYLVVGVLGYSEGEKQLAKSHQEIANLLLKDDAQLNAQGRRQEFVVHNPSQDGVSNYIYDITPGYVIRRYANEDTTQKARDMSLKDLLEHYNPNELTMNDLRWMFLYGDTDVVSSSPSEGWTEDNIGFRWINKKEGDVFLRPNIFQHPGKLYLYIPGADGRFIPQAVSPIRYRELSDKNGDVWTRVQKVINDIASASDIKARESAMGALRDLFVFNSNLGGKGTNIFYDAETDTLSYAVGNNTKGYFQFTENTSVDEAVTAIQNMLADVNPRFRINFRTDIGYYVNNNIIQVNLRSLAPVDARSYVCPINANGTPMLGFKPTNERGPRLETRIKDQMVFLDGDKYYISNEQDGTMHIFDSNHNEITDKVMKHQLSDLQRIISGEIRPTELIGVGLTYETAKKRFTYYISELSDMDSDTYVYQRKASGSYVRLHGVELNTFRTRYQYWKERLQQERAVSEELEAPVSTELPVTEFDQIPAQPAPQAPVNGEESVGTITSNGFEGVAKNPNFVTFIYNDPSSFDRLVEIGQTQELGWDERTSFEAIEDVLRKGKYGELYLKVHDDDSFAEYLDTIEECGI